MNMAYSGTGMGPYSGRVSNYPIKPGSFVLYSDTTTGGGLVSTYNDNGDGTLSAHLKVQQEQSITPLDNGVARLPSTLPA